MRVAVTGSSGLIGSALCPALEADGHEVVRLVRRAPTGAGEAQWDIAARTVDESALQDVGAIVQPRRREHRAALDGDDPASGVGVAGRRHAAARRDCGPPARPARAVCASAVGYYGYEGDELLDESAPRGSGFLAELVEAWEAAADPARTAGLRTVHLRQGLVLSRHGGALERMLLPFKLGGGGRVGSGRQWWSWVSLADAVSAYLFALEHPLEGPFNVAAPGAVTNEEFTKELGEALHRPTLLPAPAFALKTIFGEMADEMLLGGQRVSPAKLEAAGLHVRLPGPAQPSRRRSPTRLVS